MQITLAQSDAGDAATAAQLLLRIVSSPPLLALGLVSAATPWARRAARCWRSTSPFLRPSVSFLDTLVSILIDFILI